MTLLEFRFRVHEYLKGTGPDEIGAIVYLLPSSELDAQGDMEQITQGHDSRWDDRQAVVFLQLPSTAFERWGEVLPTTPDQYLFGLMADLSIGAGFGESYTVASVYQKLWLPAASASERFWIMPRRLFLLDAPPMTITDTVVMLPMVSQGSLKCRIAALEAEAIAGGTPEYRECVESSYLWEKTLLEHVRLRGPMPHIQHEVYMESGLPAGTFVYDTYEHAASEDQVSMGWFEGPYKDLVTYVDIDFYPTRDEVRFTRRVLTTRPVPAGAYTIYVNGTWFDGMVCDRYPEIARKRRALELTVMVPPGVHHEAFFDPVNIGDAVGADSTNGVLNPAVFKLDGVATTISSLKWQDGVVTMALSLASGSLSDYAIDLIDTTGTIILSLSSENANSTSATWSVPGKPWSSGDLLMLRVRDAGS